MSFGRIILLGVGGLAVLLAAFLVVRLAVEGGRTHLAMTQEVAAPPADVFPYLVEPDLLRTWLEGFQKSEAPPGLTVGVGVRSRDHFIIGGRTVVLETTIVEFQKPQLLVVETNHPDAISRVTYRITPGAKGSLVSLEMESRYARLWIRLLEPFVRPSIQAMNRRSLEALARELSARKTRDDRKTPATR